MRKITTATIAATALILTGCADDASQTTPATITVTEQVPAPATTTNKVSTPQTGSIVGQMRRSGVPVGNLTDEVATDTGNAICEALDAGAPKSEILRISEQHMVGWDTADNIIAIEVMLSNLCPKHSVL